ncbi:hypothetical protein FJV46_13485 [Arthrobacter agilis]|uniref:hypothetical protein n=1 Tax=Arthrobacter agilis TaxID=37921 RepID=UPI000B3580E9|nr:hypothetical protein [Arthrobacter agilis]OUM44744.1 hypothetical protein B8W74_02300 [Arthrobacter agilis]PPB47069.1 hypothetical protein CI784_03330 [Arthrobacter agilis]TPV22482.1 hypothetical protein FJV46_13485 [Arthrobacter agilis]VDR32294.1 Uncharacterised protein [Arthrobacter agilis]
MTLASVLLLGVLENLFEYEGKPGHEIVHVFAVTSGEIDAIPLDAELTVLDEGSTVHWTPIERMSRPLYPIGTLHMLQATVPDES